MLSAETTSSSRKSFDRIRGDQAVWCVACTVRVSYSTQLCVVAKGVFSEPAPEPVTGEQRGAGRGLEGSQTTGAHAPPTVEVASLQLPQMSGKPCSAVGETFGKVMSSRIFT